MDDRFDPVKKKECGVHEVTLEHFWALANKQRGSLRRVGVDAILQGLQSALLVGNDDLLEGLLKSDPGSWSGVMVFSNLNQSFAFHASPEDFISTRLHGLAVSEPGAIPAPERSIVRASILNRNVHIVSSYQLCKEILRSGGNASHNTITALNRDEHVRQDAFAVGPAYRELMADFFPAPNILMEDGLPHREHKKSWKDQLSALPSDAEPTIREIAQGFINSTLVPGMTVDLYESLKSLSWDLLLGVFLSVNQTNPILFSSLETSHEILLRGQFSLFPVAVNTPFWQSPRSKGLKARRELQKLLSEHIKQESPASCPLLRNSFVDQTDISSHCLLFTSSIANKALSSLLTAMIANLFLMPGEQSLAALLRSQTGQSRQATLKSIQLETERLCPPVVGVMRRVKQDIVLAAQDVSQGHHVPAGHDVWLYLAGASRDTTAFEDAEKFHFDRFMQGEDDDRALGFAFGDGPKSCLGTDTVRRMVSIVAEEIIASGVNLEGTVEELGVKSWLGWVASAPTAIAKDLKQLPCQRPRKPIMVEIKPA